MRGGAPANPFGFAGQYQDPTGLYFMRARMYDPTTGRFISPDPLASRLTEPRVASCVYARNNPTRFVDPSGLESQPAIVTNPGGCLAALVAFGLISEGTALQIAAALLLQVGSITLFGVTYTLGAPVSLAGIAAGLMLEATALGTEYAALWAVSQACFEPAR